MENSITICGPLPADPSFPMDTLCGLHSYHSHLPRTPDYIVASLEGPPTLPEGSGYDFIYRERTANAEALKQLKKQLPARRIKRLEDRAMPLLVERHFGMKEAYTGVMAVAYFLCCKYKYIYVTGMDLYMNDRAHRARLPQHANFLQWVKDMGGPVIYDKHLEAGIADLLFDRPG